MIINHAKSTKFLSNSLAASYTPIYLSFKTFSKICQLNYVNLKHLHYKQQKTAVKCFKSIIIQQFLNKKKTCSHNSINNSFKLFSASKILFDRWHPV